MATISEDFSTGLQAHWTLDEESGTRADSVGSNDLTDESTVGFDTGIQSNAVALVSASSDYLSAADNAALRVDDTWSVSYWFYANSLPTGGGGMYIMNARSGENGWGVGIQENGGSVYHSVWAGSGSFSNTRSTATVSASTWYHCVVYFNGSNTKLYVNGTVSETINVPAITNPTNGFHLGKKYTSSGDYFNGLVDEVTFWNTEITSANEATIYNSGSGIPYAPPQTIKSINGLAIASIKSINGLA